jgi:Tfp pilus assembly protein PilN
MKPVNLLPERHRPRTPTGGRQGSAYIVLGGLGALLIAVVIYVLTLNDINTQRDSIAQAKQETADATARIASLSAYGNFVKVKDERVQGVRSLADGRFDWELLMRELARVLPDGVWIQSADASLGSSVAANGSSSASTDSAGATNPNAATVTVTGCAKSQQSVAVTLVRLKQVAGATDVALKQSSKQDASGASSGDSSGTAAGGCGDSNYSFQADVSLDKSKQASAQVPASLGGGS